MRSSSGSAATRPCWSRTGVRSRTSASANRRSSFAFACATPRNSVDVLRRRKPLEAEVLQPPQLQSVPHHGVQPAEHLVLDKPLGGVPERERVDRGHAAPALGLRDRDHDPVQRVGQRDGRESVAQSGGELLVRRRLAGRSV